MLSSIKHDSSGVVVTALFLRIASPWRRKLKRLIGQTVKYLRNNFTCDIPFPDAVKDKNRIA